MVAIAAGRCCAGVDDMWLAFVAFKDSSRPVTLSKREFLCEPIQLLCESTMREILLSPNDSGALTKFYERAAAQSVDLLIATAFLTEWPIHRKLSKACKNVLIVVGTDFGLTRKKALTDLLCWVSKDKTYNVLAVPAFLGGSFHPKIIAWKDRKGEYFALFGSSNLTAAAFNQNYEANVIQEISEGEFQKVKSWLRNIAKRSEVITADWIKKYKEADRVAKTGKKRPVTKASAQVVDLKVRVLKKHLKRISDRRNQQEQFAEIREPLLDVVANCAAGEISNKLFWKKFWGLWSNHPSRFQGSGVQWFGGNANWKQACTSLLRIVEGPDDIFDLDLVVQTEIDRLCHLKNPARRAWLSEMICHFYPNWYPVLDGPVRIWLRHIGYRAQRGATEGSKYVDLSRKMRIAKDQAPEISTLAELDVVIWNIVKDAGLLN